MTVAEQAKHGNGAADAAYPGNEEPPGLGELAHAGVRGAIAAMAMTGMRVFTVQLGIVDEPPPQAIARQKARGVFRHVPRRYRRAGEELAHWGYGAGGGVAFGLLPDGVRRSAWAGPVYGFVVWLGFEMGIAPVLGLSQAKKPRLAERAALMVDHLLYGFILSNFRRRARD